MGKAWVIRCLIPDEKCFAWYVKKLIKSLAEDFFNFLEFTFIDWTMILILNGGQALIWVRKSSKPKNFRPEDEIPKPWDYVKITFLGQ